MINQAKRPEYSPSIWLLITIFVFFLGLAIVFTWPLILNIDSAIIGRPDFSDGPFFLWNLWWVKRSILALSNPFWTNYVYYPSDVNLSLHTLTLTTGIIYLPFSKWISLILGLNIIQLLSFAFSSLGMFQLLNYLVKPKSLLQSLTAIIPSLIFGFSPFVFSHLLAGHYNLSMLWPIPYLILFLYKTIRESELKNSLLLGLFLVLTGYLDQQLLFFSAVIAGPIILFELIFNFKRFLSKEKRLYFLISFGIFAIFFLLPYGWIVQKSWNYQVNFETFNNADIDLLLSSNPLNPLLNYPRLTLVMKIIGNYRENIVPIGFTSTVLSLLSFVFFKKNLKDKLAYLLVLIAGFCLTLGPYLQINGQVFTWIKLPFYYLQRLPLLNVGIVPTRFIIIVYFALALLTGLFLSSLFEWMNRRNLFFSESVILIVLMSMILFENYSGQMMMESLPNNQYLNKISNEPGDFTILPYNTTQRDGYLQTQHQKKVVTGFLGRRIHDSYNNQYKDNFFVEKFIRNEGDLIPIFSKSDRDVIDSLKKYNIGYIIIDKSFQDQRKIGILRDYLVSIGLKVDYDDGEMLAIKVVN